MKLPGCFDSCFKAQTETKTGNSCHDCCTRSACKSYCCVFFCGRRITRDNNSGHREQNVFNNSVNDKGAQ